MRMRVHLGSMRKRTFVKDNMGIKSPTVCLFCHEPLDDLGLAFYEHVQEQDACNFSWHDWMEEIPKDHGGA